VEDNNTQTRTILVVDDDQTVLFVTAEVLKLKGYKVVTAVNGLQAIETARRENPDLILMDLYMPVLNGFSAIKQLKQDKKFSRVPIVAITGYHDENVQKSAFDAGCDDYLRELDVILKRLKWTGSASAVSGDLD
jgi:CheY-like chemotaxis protein